MKRIRSAADAATLGNRDFAIDTTFVLFFLAVEFGRSLSSFSFDSVLLGMSSIMMLVLPFFFSTEIERPDFGRWVVGRALIAALAIVLGMVYSSVLGVMIPDTFRFLPMSLLIVTAMVSCYIQFYGVMKLRPAK